MISYPKQVFSVMFYFGIKQFLAEFSFITFSKISSTKTELFFLILAIFDTLNAIRAGVWHLVPKKTPFSSFSWTRMMYKLKYKSPPRLSTPNRAANRLLPKSGVLNRQPVHFYLALEILLNTQYRKIRCMDVAIEIDLENISGPCGPQAKIVEIPWPKYLYHPLI